MIPPIDTSHMTILRGDGTWPWSAWIDGADIVVLNAKTTAFGGDNDDGDNGETASGLSTRMNPNFIGCALPMAHTGNGAALKAALGGSPIPKIPWRTPVIVTEVSTGRQISAQVIDLGPAKKTGHALDLTVAAARMFNSHATANNFGTICHYRIPGGAKYIQGGAAKS